MKRHFIVFTAVLLGLLLSKPLKAWSASNCAVPTRPLCAYPNTAKWNGVGSTDSAANFVCVDGKHDPRDFRVVGPGSK